MTYKPERAVEKWKALPEAKKLDHKLEPTELTKLITERFEPIEIAAAALRELCQPVTRGASS